MFDFVKARETMLDSQVRVNDVTDGAVQAALNTVPRENFLPKAKSSLAYGDTNVAVDPGRFMLRPRDFAKMLEAADILPTDIILDIACGRGYSTAVMAQLGETVVALEDNDDYVVRANSLLEKSSVTNSAVVLGDLKVGAAEHGPFDVIFVGGAIADVPHSWFEQLANNGRLVCAVIDGPLCRVTVFTKVGDRVGERIIFDASVPALPGFTAKPTFQL